MPETLKLFVYGTLRRGEHAHYMLSQRDAKFLKECKTHSRYHLYDQGAFPGMVENELEEGGVHGELFEITRDVLRVTDYYEGVSHGLFRQAFIELEDGEKAIAYLVVQPCGTRIPSGRWVKNGQKEENA